MTIIKAFGVLLLWLCMLVVVVLSMTGVAALACLLFITIVG